MLLRRITVRVSFIALASAIAACGTRIAYMPMNPSPRALQARDASQVELFTTSKPEKPYVEVGMIEAQQDTWYSVASTQDVFASLRAEAGRQGCDGLIVTGSKDSTVGGGKGAMRTLEGYRGICIVYRDAAAVNR
jgi:hypothetical protein